MLTTAPSNYGVADPAEARLMSGREFLEAIMDGRLPAPPIAKTLSFTLVEIGDGFAVFEGDAGEHLLNPLGVVHGGWALTLIDSATGCAGQTILDRDQGQFFPRDHQGCGPGPGRRACPRPRPARIVDAAGRLLAHGTSTLMVLAAAS
jgi:acyl-coenzyme A thioesterase PaaI-like protein